MIQEIGIREEEGGELFLLLFDNVLVFGKVLCHVKIISDFP